MASESAILGLPRSCAELNDVGTTALVFHAPPCRPHTYDMTNLVHNEMFVTLFSAKNPHCSERSKYSFRNHEISGDLYGLSMRRSNDVLLLCASKKRGSVPILHQSYCSFNLTLRSVSLDRCSTQVSCHQIAPFWSTSEAPRYQLTSQRQGKLMGVVSPFILISVLSNTILGNESTLSSRVTT